MKKIDVAELLKDCPTGMELDSTMFEKVTFVRVQMDRQFPIEIAINGIRSKYLTEEGCFHDRTLLPEAKCVIFPKGKTTWEGFQRPFKDGDVVAYNPEVGKTTIYIYRLHKAMNTSYYVALSGVLERLLIGTNPNVALSGYNETARFATEEEKERLFRAIKDNGYKWNAETKTLKKLLKFKVGDRVRIKSIDWYNENKDEFDQVKCGNQIFTYPMTKLCSKIVTIRCVNAKDCYYVLYEDGGYRSWTDEMIECKVEEENKPKFKDGDVLYIHSTSAWICIYNEGGEIANVYYKYVAMSSSTFTHDDAPLCCRDHVKEIRLATEEEKEKLFKAIKDNGYQWNTETKTLEKLPKFKVGDKVRGKYTNSIYTISGITPTGYELTNGQTFTFNAEDCHELVTGKFDITTLKPFDKVLVRNTNNGRWRGQFYMSYDKNEEYPFECTYNCWMQCIPFEGNEYLLDKTDSCNDFYKIW